MVRLPCLVLSVFALAACASSPGGGGGARSPTADPRVRPLVGQVPPELSADVRWLNASPSSLAALRGRVVFVQFAFPT